jgi:alpha-glucuronidase
LLFFHNKQWLDKVVLYNSSSAAGVQKVPYNNSGVEKVDNKVTLFNWIRDRQTRSLEELNEMVQSWDALEETMRAAGDAERFAGVQARFAQQQTDARVFHSTIIGYYHNLSGLPL